MDKPISYRSKGFTLIELLVVIAIIAVLATVASTAGIHAINKAKGTSALAVCKEIEIGINRFVEDNGYLPLSDVDGDMVFGSNSQDGMELVNILLNIDKANNPRGVVYLNIREGKSNKNGLIYSADGSSVTGLYDPWGGDYQIAVDGDFDKEIDVLNGQRLRGRNVAVWTLGGKPNSADDDVTSW